MASVSGGSSRLNPNAPLYIPAALRQVEDFSSEWWNLITSSMWFRDYWLSQHQEADMFYANGEDNLDVNDIADFLPDEFDLGVDDDVLTMESQFEEFIHSSGNKESKILPEPGVVACMEEQTCAGTLSAIGYKACHEACEYPGKSP